MDMKERRRVRNHLRRLIDTMSLMSALQETPYFPEENAQELIKAMKSGVVELYDGLEREARKQGWKPLPPSQH